MINRFSFRSICLFLFTLSLHTVAAPIELRVGRAGHAFDHLGSIGEQAATAAESGANIIYATGLGALGYQGLPSEEKLKEQRGAVLAYNQQARAKGIKLIFGYVCATSLVKLDAFDDNWSERFQSQFETIPAQWRQVGSDGKPLPSWYGGDYQPACMNNPDWRSYEKFMVREQLESGHDGIFFDNPTVHPQGCYCRYCMGKFAGWLHDQGIEILDVSLAATRKLPAKFPQKFVQFRTRIARDFLEEMRAYARTIKRDALVTCNNSLNTPDVLFSQARTYGYNIQEFAKAEDLVLVEDMKSQPRLLGDDSVVEYGPTYRLLESLSREKPVVAVTIAEGDYHTPPGLVRLAMAEAAAHNASYLSWPTWPEKERERMVKLIRPQAEFLRRNERILNNTQPRSDVLLFLPFRRYLETDKCVAAEIAAKLTRSNWQYKVITEDDFTLELSQRLTQALVAAGRVEGEAKAKLTMRFTLPLFLTESLSVLTPEEKAMLQKYQEQGGIVVAADQGDWQKKIKEESIPSLQINASSNLRVILRDQPEQAIAHIYNLGVERVSSFEDKLHPLSNVELKVRIRSPQVHAVRALSADENGTPHTLKYKLSQDKTGTWVETMLPKVDISTILLIEF